MYRNAIATALVCLSATGASAQAVTERVLNDQTPWALRCPGTVPCQMRAALSENGNLVSQLLIYEVGGDMVIEHLVPLGIDLAKGVTMIVDGDSVSNTIMLVCKEAGCVGYAPLDDGLLNALKRGLQLDLTFTGFDDDTVYSIPYSLTGFTAVHTDYLAATAE